METQNGRIGFEYSPKISKTCAKASTTLSPSPFETSPNQRTTNADISRTRLPTSNIAVKMSVPRTRCTIFGQSAVRRFLNASAARATRLITPRDARGGETLLATCICKCLWIPATLPEPISYAASQPYPEFRPRREIFLQSLLRHSSRDNF